MNRKTNKELYTGLIRHRGAMLELADRCKKHRNTIRKILRGGDGEFNNEEVVLEAAKLLHELEVSSNERRKVVNVLLTKSKKLARVAQ
jgi:hypothetical protein